MAAQAAQPGDPDGAGEIYQAHLDTVSDALLKGDVEVCMAHFALPLLIRTTQSETLFETREDLLQDTVEHSNSLRGHGVTDYIRLAKEARPLSDTLIEGWHETHILRNAIMMIPSYMSRMVLRLEDGNWKVAEAEHELTSHRFPLHSVAPAKGSFTASWKQEDEDARTRIENALPIYRAFLNVLSAAQNRGDFDAWAGMFTYPYDAHYAEADIVFNGPAQAQPFFNAVAEQLANPDTSMIRNIERAEFISGNQICGYHTGTIVQGDKIVVGPVKSRMILSLVEGQWKCSSVTNSLSADKIPETSDDIIVSDELPTMREIEERMRK